MSVGWENQPRSSETGRWRLRHGYVRRSRTIKIRLTAKEEENIRSIASVAGMTVTHYIVSCCLEGRKAMAHIDETVRAEPQTLEDEMARHRVMQVRRNRRRG